jgi:hypothetical protein
MLRYLVSFLAGLALCFLPFIVGAQLFHGGFRLGITASQVSGDRLAGFNKAGLTGGVYAGFSMSNDFDLDIGMLFVQKGSRKNPRPSRNDFSKYIMRLNYIELPVMLVYKQHEKIEIEAGLSFGILIKTQDVEFDEYGVIPQADPFRPYELSGNLGLNYLLNDNIKVNFRFNNSLTHIRAHKSGATYWLNTGQFNTVLMLGITYTPNQRSS